MSTLEDLIALNEEVTLLAVAGVPLNPDMVRIGRNRKHELTRINAAVARRVSRGEQLVDAVSAEDDSLPEVYQDIIESGLRCERLPTVLEGLCDYSRSTMTLKRGLSTALIYPVLIATLAYGLFVASLVFYIPTLLETYREMEVPFGPAIEACRLLRSTLVVWGPIPFVGLVLLVVAWFRGSHRPTIGWTGFLAPFSWLPWMRPALQDARRAGVARLTALLLEHDVPLADSLRLAAGAADNRRLQRAVEAGRPAPSLPPLLHWAITHPFDEGATRERIESLKLAADVYQTRAESQLQGLRRRTPVVALVVIGGGMTLLYFLSVFGPFVQLLRGLT